MLKGSPWAGLADRTQAFGGRSFSSLQGSVHGPFRSGTAATSSAWIASSRDVATPSLCRDRLARLAPARGRILSHNVVHPAPRMNMESPPETGRPSRIVNNHDPRRPPVISLGLRGRASPDVKKATSIECIPVAESGGHAPCWVKRTVRARPGFLREPISHFHIFVVFK